MGKKTGQERMFKTPHQRATEEDEVDRIISLVWFICCAGLAVVLVPKTGIYEALGLSVMLYFFGFFLIISFWNNIVRGHASWYD